MTKTLYIAEKPNTMKAVAALMPGERRKMGSGIVIGNHYFAPLQGHIMMQASPDHYLPDDIPRTAKGTKVWRTDDLPILPEKWQLTIDPKKKHLFDTVKQMLAECDEVVHLGDADQEGQLLVDEVLDFLGNRKPVSRVLILDYNEKKVREALKNIKSNNDPIFVGWSKWALARTRYDWLLGINCTRMQTLNWRKAGGNGVMPVGSVQSPLLKIIVDRDREIEGFQSKPFFTISAMVNHVNGTFKAKWIPSANQAGLDEENRLINPEIANALHAKLSDSAGQIVEYVAENKKKSAPLLFAMSSLQMEANDKFGYSANEVLDASQYLYDEIELITYPRVDIEYVFEVNHGEAPEILQAIASNAPFLSGLIKNADPSIKSAVFNDSKVKVHHGIMPTAGKKSIDGLSEIQKNIYELIVRRYIAQFYPNYEYKSTTIKLDVDGETLTASGQVPIVEGWKVVIKADEANTDAESEESENLPLAQEGDRVQVESVDIINKKTTPPPRFTEKLIIQAMLNIHKYVTDKEAKKRLKEGDGIGTDATRAAHIEGLKESGYITPVKKGSKQLISTTEARALIDALQDVVKDPGTAGIFKLDLDRVAAGELSMQNFMAQTEAFVSDIIANAKESSFSPGAAGPACPTCSTGTLRRIKGKNGFFWACSNYQATPPCKATFEDSKGNAVLQKENHACPACKVGQLRKIKGPKGVFWGCSRFKEDCKYTAQDNKGKPAAPSNQDKPQSTSEHTCPDCTKPLIHRQKAGKGGYDFWGCSGYPACTNSFKNNAGKPVIPPPRAYD